MPKDIGLGAPKVPRPPTPPVVPRGRYAPSGAGFSQTATPETYQLPEPYTGGPPPYGPHTAGLGTTLGTSPEWYAAVKANFVEDYLSNLRTTDLARAEESASYVRSRTLATLSAKQKAAVRNQPTLTIGAPGILPTGGGGGGGGRSVSLSGGGGQLIMWRIGF